MNDQRVYTVIYKEFCSIAIQTDDYGCQNGCSSMYVNKTSTPYQDADSLENACQSQSANNLDKDMTMDFEDEDEPCHSSINAISSIMRVIEELESSSSDTLVDSDVIAGHDVVSRNGAEGGINVNSTSKNSLFQCSYCEKTFPNSSQLICHLRTHTGEKPFECLQCEKNFARRYDLMKHMRIHTGEKPFKCSHCDKKFAERGNLNKHLKKHKAQTGEIEENIPTSDKDAAATTATPEKQSAHSEHAAQVFECAICKKSFTTRGILKAHLKRHTGNKPFDCSQCDKKFTSKYDMIKHLRVHTGEKPFECPHCDKKFSEKGNLRKHLVLHLRKPKGDAAVNPSSIEISLQNTRECPQCGKAFTSKCDLIKHYRVHSGEKPFECSRCFKKFSEKGNLNKHMLRHCRKFGDENSSTQQQQQQQQQQQESSLNGQRSQKIFECPDCKKTCTSKHDLTKHLRVHSGEKPFECPTCHKKFSESGNLNKHVKIHKRKPKKHIDSRSDENTADRQTELTEGEEEAFVVHVEQPVEKAFSEEAASNKTHNKDKGKTFDCSFCDEKFDNRVDLKHHLNIHPDSKKFACSYCEKKFSSNCDLRKHCRVHTGEKPYECSYCKKRFTESGNLNRHVTIHTGKRKSFKCSHCKKTFLCQASLKKHLHERKNTCGRTAQGEEDEGRRIDQQSVEHQQEQHEEEEQELRYTDQEEVVIVHIEGFVEQEQ